MSDQMQFSPKLLVRIASVDAVIHYWKRKQQSRCKAGSLSFFKNSLLLLLLYLSSWGSGPITKQDIRHYKL